MFLTFHKDMSLDGVRILHCPDDNDFWIYQSNRYVILEEKVLKIIIQNWIREFCYTKAKKNTKNPIPEIGKEKEEEAKKLDFPINPNTINAIYQSLKIACRLWIDHSPRKKSYFIGGVHHSPKDYKASDLISFQNCLFNVKCFYETRDPIRSVIPHNPLYFSQAHIPYSISIDDCGLVRGFQPSILPQQFLAFLEDVFQESPEDGQSIQALREFLGNCLVDDKQFEKGIWIQGQPRSGKGTLSSLAQMLLGRPMAGVEIEKPAENLYGSLTGVGMIDRFGLSDAVGKRLICINELSLSQMPRNDRCKIQEILLQLISRDPITVMRKGRDSIPNLIIPCKILVTTNQMPDFPDKSGAILSRFIHLSTKKDYLGKENTKLLDILSQEIPRVFWWAITGYCNLLDRGGYVQPESTMKNLMAMRRYSNCVKTFLEERCIVDSFQKTSKRCVYDAYLNYAISEGGEQLNDKSFGRMLAQLTSHYTFVESTTNHPKEYKGIGLKDNLVNEDRKHAESILEKEEKMSKQRPTDNRSKQYKDD